MKGNRTVFTIAGTVIGLMMPLQMALADSEEALPPLPVLTSEWWQWALSIPSSDNPLLDPTGQNCMVGQRGFVWFLAGAFNGKPAIRSCSMPEDKVLFFPVINIVNISVPKDVCGSSGAETVKQLRADIKPFIDGVHDLSVKVDGQYINHNLLQRIQSIPFEVAFPAENLFGGGPSCPADIYSPAVDDGYYVVLQPLRAGNHTIEFHGEDALGTQDVKYSPSVVPVVLK
jgi:hypothetical protein